MNLTQSEFQNIKIRVEKIGIALMNHERKDSAKIGFPINNYRKFEINEKPFFYVGSHIFLVVVESVIDDARKIFPKNFGTGNAKSVIRALNKTRFLCENLKGAIRIYGNENFILAFDDTEDDKNNRILRIDLFRKLDKINNVKRKFEFTGGLFHVLKHFSVDNLPLSTGNEINNVSGPTDVIKKIINAFYLLPGEFDKINKNEYRVIEEINEEYQLNYFFYYEENTKVYFLKTIFKSKIKNGRKVK